MTLETNRNSPAGASGGQTFRNATETLRDNVGDALDRGKTDLSLSADSARQAFGEDVAKLKADLINLQKTVAGFAAEAGGTAASTVKGVGQAVASQAGAVVSETAAKAGDVASAATDQVKTFASELEGMARRNPLGTLAGTLAVGVVLGMMSRGRS